MTDIGEAAFLDCASLSSVTIPAGVTGIGDEAFSGCDSLTAIVSRGSYAEQYCMDNHVNYAYSD